MENIEKQEIFYLDIERVKEPAMASRTVIVKEPLEDLAGSIKVKGIINPLIVKVSGDDWEVTAGHRRLLAAQVLGLKQVPCIIRNESVEESIKTTLQENYFREDPNPVDEGEYFSKLQEKHGMSTEEISKLANKSENYVRVRLSILTRNPQVAAALQGGQVNLSQALEINRASTPEIASTLLEVAINHGANTRSLRAIRGDYEKRLPPLAPGSQEKPPEGQIYPERKYLFECPVCKKGFPTTEIYPLSVCHGCHDGIMEGIEEQKKQETGKE